ncbi:MAG: hypothetical protein IJ419_01295 [Agathobacter sp.]|nr:hypothetical protein [Agathobacter sp.]
MFNIFKKSEKTQNFTDHVQLHDAMEKKMSIMIACDALHTMKVRSMKDIVNGNVRYNVLTDEQLHTLARQMQKADLIMIKATAEMTRKCKEGNGVVFDDNTVYTMIQDAQELVRPNELNSFATRESMIQYISNKAELVLRMEGNMLRFFADFARSNNQAIVVHG